MICLLFSKKDGYIFYNPKKEEIYLYSGQTSSRINYPPGYIGAFILLLPMIFISIICGLNYRNWILCDMAYLICVHIGYFMDTKRIKEYVNHSASVAIKNIFADQAYEMLRKANIGEKRAYSYCTFSETLYVWILLLLINCIFTHAMLMVYLLILSIEVYTFTRLPLYLNKAAIKRAIIVLESRVTGTVPFDS